MLQDKIEHQILVLYLWNGFWSMWSPSVFGFQGWLFIQGRHRRKQSIEVMSSLFANLKKKRLICKTRANFPERKCAEDLSSIFLLTNDKFVDLVSHNEAKASTTPGLVLKDQVLENKSVRRVFFIPDVPGSLGLRCSTGCNNSCLQITLGQNSMFVNK